MRIADYGIKHPQVIGILLMTLTVFGLLSSFGLGKELIANVELPEVLILAVYPGASPETVEREVVDPLEEEFTLIDGIDSIQSSSQNGFATIVLTMDWDADLEAKKNDLRDKINNVMEDLPDGLAGRPLIYDLGSSALPVYSVLVESDFDDARFARYLNDDVIPRFSRISGVSSVLSRGIEESTVRVTLDPGKLESLDVTAWEAFGAVALGQGTVPAGDVLEGPDLLALQADGEYRSLADIEYQPVGYSTEGRRIYLRDVATVELAPRNPEYRVFSSGSETVTIELLKKQGADTQSLIDQARELEEAISRESGGVVRFSSVLDDGETIDLTLNSVLQSAWLGGLLAVIVLLLFLHDLRAALIVSLSIPFTVFLTVILMRFRGMSLNMMTLAGMTVSIGMMVDSSIVILENTVRHRKEGEEAPAAASLGADEVGGAVIASTSTSLSVFIPILFLTGFAGAILKEVAWVLVFALGASALTAVVIVPWLSARLLRVEAHWKPLLRFGEVFDRLFQGFANLYRRLLSSVLDHKAFVILLSLVLIVASGFLLISVGGEVFSAPDMNEFEVSVRFPSGYDLDRAEAKIREISRLVRSEVPEIETDLWYAGLGDKNIIIDSGNPTRGYGRVKLSRTVQRDRSVFEIVNHLNAVLPAQIPDADITVKNGGLATKMAYALGGAGFQVRLSGSNWDNVLNAALSTRALLASDPQVSIADLDIRVDWDVMAVALNRESTGRLAVDPIEAGRNLRILFNGEEAGSLRFEGDTYEIFIDSTLAGAQRQAGILGRLRTRNRLGQGVPYSAFSDWERRQGTDQIPHVDRLPAVTVTAQLTTPDINAIRGRTIAALDSADFGPGIEWTIVGEADAMGDIFRDLAWSLAISIFLVYVVMVIQFERFSQPLVIMGAVPFVLIGVALSLTAFGSLVTMMSFFGVIALGGMVVNNAIVLVEFANQQRQKGQDVRNALLDAGQIRLKPILMTTLTTILGLIPLAFALGEGAEVYAPLGQVIGGGLLTSTLISLVIVPVLYESLETRPMKKRAPRVLVGAAVLLVFTSSLGAQNAPWTVESLTVRSLSYDPTLALRQAEGRAASARLRGVQAQRGPTLSFEAGTSYLSDPMLSVSAGALGSIPTAGGTILLPGEDTDVLGQAHDFRYDVSVVLSQNLFTWGKINAGVDAARSGTLATGSATLAREQELTTGILIAMESLSLLEDMIGTIDRQEELGQRLAQLTLQNFEAGFLLETEYRDTRNRLQQIRLSGASLREERNLILLELETATGLESLVVADLQLPAVTRDPTAYSLPDTDVLVTMAWRRNPTLIALGHLSDMAQASLAANRGAAAGKPDFALLVEFGIGGGFDRAPDYPHGNWTVTIGARTDVFDSGYRRASIRQAEAELASAELDHQIGLRDMETYVKSTLYSMELNLENLGYYQALGETDQARAIEKRSSWETGYGREEEWLLAELDRLASELMATREFLAYLRSDRSLRNVAGLLPD